MSVASDSESDAPTRASESRQFDPWKSTLWCSQGRVVICGGSHSYHQAPHQVPATTIPFSKPAMAEGNRTGAFAVTNAINATTTPAKFDALIRSNPGYCVDFGGRCGWTALHVAAKFNNNELIKYICERGNAAHYLRLTLDVGQECATPLFAAIEINGLDLERKVSLETIQLLLDLGSDPHLSGGNRVSVYEWLRAQIRSGNKHQDTYKRVLDLINKHDVESIKPVAAMATTHAVVARWVGALATADK